MGRAVAIFGGRETCARPNDSSQKPIEDSVFRRVEVARRKNYRKVRLQISNFCFAPPDIAESKRFARKGRNYGDGLRKSHVSRGTVGDALFMEG